MPVREVFARQPLDRLRHGTRRVACHAMYRLDIAFETAALRRADVDVLNIGAGVVERRAAKMRLILAGSSHGRADPLETIARQPSLTAPARCAAQSRQRTD
jgi:hypothetical protein